MKCIRWIFKNETNALVETDSDKQRLRRGRKVCLCCCSKLCLPKAPVNKPFNEWKKSDCERHEETCPATFFIYLAALSFLTRFSTILVLRLDICSRAVDEGCIFSCFYLDQSSVIFEPSYFNGCFLTRAKKCACFLSKLWILAFQLY